MIFTKINDLNDFHDFHASRRPTAREAVNSLVNITVLGGPGSDGKRVFSLKWGEIMVLMKFHEFS